MLELVIQSATSEDAYTRERDLPRARTLRIPSEPGRRLGVGRDASRCALATPKDWRFVSRMHLEFRFTDDRRWTVEWLQGSHTRPVALVHIERDGVSESMQYGARLPLGGAGVGTVTVTDLARRRRVTVTWRQAEGGRELPPLDSERRGDETVWDGEWQMLLDRLTGTQVEVLSAMACDWAHGRQVKRAKSTGELCSMLHLSVASVERSKTTLRREFYSSELCPELNALLGPGFLDAKRQIHGGWDLIAQTAVLYGIQEVRACPCGLGRPPHPASS